MCAAASKAYSGVASPLRRPRSDPPTSWASPLPPPPQDLIDRALRDRVVTRARPFVDPQGHFGAFGGLGHGGVEGLDVLAAADGVEELFERRVGRGVFGA